MLSKADRDCYRAADALHAFPEGLITRDLYGTLMHDVRKRLERCGVGDLGYCGMHILLSLDADGRHGNHRGPRHPNRGFAVQSARLMREIVRERNRRGLTVFLTSHNMDEAEEMCSRLAIINQDRIAAIDTPDGLRGVVRSRQYVEMVFEGEPLNGSDLKWRPPAFDRCAQRMDPRLPGRILYGRSQRQRHAVRERLGAGRMTAKRQTQS